MERLYVEIGPSRYYCLLCLLIHLFAFAALWISGLSWYFVAGFGMALVASLVHHLLLNGLLADSESVIAIQCDNGAWYLKIRDSGWVSVWIDAHVTLTRYLVVMNFRDQGGRRYSVALLPDSTSLDDFRRTKVLLRLA